MLNKKDHIIREIIKEDYLNSSKKNIKKIESFKKEDISLSSRILIWFYKNKKINLKDNIHIITEAIYLEIFNNLNNNNISNENIYEQINDLVDLFYPACDKDRVQFLEDINETEYKYLRCEGRFCPDTHLISYLLGYSDYEINMEGKDKSGGHIIETTYFNKEFIRCPECGDKKTKIKNDNLAICQNCNFELKYKLEDIYWCFGGKCNNSCEFNLRKLKKHQPITINHILGDVNEISYLSAWFNRLLGILPRCFCFSCKNILVPEVNKINQKNPTAYRVVYYQCKNNKCEEYEKSIYLNHCSNKRCKAYIDNRTCKHKCENGFSICNHCYACCNQSIFDRKGIRKNGHMEQNRIFCPECADQLMVSKFSDNKFYCRKCKKTKPIKFSAHREWKKYKELQDKIYTSKNNQRVIKSILNSPLN